MKNMTMKTAVMIFSVSLLSSLAIAADHGEMDNAGMNHSAADHSKMGHAMEAHAEQVMGVGVIHRVSRLNKMVNITHEPIAELNWPEMTMDLPVADSVDLGSIKTGEKVKFHLELDADKKYVITEIVE